MSKRTCHAVIPPNGEACGQPARHVAIFADGDRSYVCDDCALSLQQTAGAHGTQIKFELIDWRRK